MKVSGEVHEDKPGAAGTDVSLAVCYNGGKEDTSTASAVVSPAVCCMWASMYVHVCVRVCVRACVRVYCNLMQSLVLDCLP